MTSSSTFPHPASVGNLDYCGLCGRLIPRNQRRAPRQFSRQGDEEVITVRICRDHLAPGESQREGIEINAIANAHGGGFEVVPKTPREARYYSAARSREEIKKMREAAPRTNDQPGQTARPRERRSTRRTSKASASSGEDGLADPPLASRPRGRGAERLLYELLRVGLSPDALRPAAALCCALDERARSEGAVA